MNGIEHFKNQIEGLMNVERSRSENQISKGALQAYKQVLELLPMLEKAIDLEKEVAVLQQRNTYLDEIKRILENKK